MEIADEIEVIILSGRYLPRGVFWTSHRKRMEFDNRVQLTAGRENRDD